VNGGALALYDKAQSTSSRQTVVRMDPLSTRGAQGKGGAGQDRRALTLHGCWYFTPGGPGTMPVQRSRRQARRVKAGAAIRRAITASKRLPLPTGHDSHLSLWW
jgi:hypothetical protein